MAKNIIEKQWFLVTKVYQSNIAKFTERKNEVLLEKNNSQDWTKNVLGRKLAGRRRLLEIKELIFYLLCSLCVKV